MYSAVTGKFLSTDPLGEWDEEEYQKQTNMSFVAQSGGCTSCGGVSGEVSDTSIRGESPAKYGDGMNLYRNYFGVNGTDAWGLEDCFLRDLCFKRNKDVYNNCVVFWQRKCHKWFFPDASSRASCVIGGMIACKARQVASDAQCPQCVDDENTKCHTGVEG